MGAVGCGGGGGGGKAAYVLGTGAGVLSFACLLVLELAVLDLEIRVLWNMFSGIGIFEMPGISSIVLRLSTVWCVKYAAVFTREPSGERERGGETH